MVLTKVASTYICYSEMEAENLIADMKKDTECKVEHSMKYKAKKDRKTGDIIEEEWVVTITKKYEA